MPPRPPQHLASRRVSSLAAVCLVALGLGGCLSRNAADTTGSIGGSASAASAQADALGRRVEADPGNAALVLEYAALLRSQGRHAQTVAVLQQATLRNPSDLQILGAYGKALADAGRFKEAADVLSRAHRPDRPDWRILSAQGAVQDQLGQFATAQRFYEAALKIAPGEPSVLSNQGLSFALARRLPEAERVLTAASASPSADRRVRQNLALVLGLEGKLAQAETVLKRDLPPAEVETNMAAIRRMVSQPNSWKAIRQSDGAAASASPPASPAGETSRQAAL